MVRSVQAQGNAGARTREDVVQITCNHHHHHGERASSEVLVGRRRDVDVDANDTGTFATELLRCILATRTVPGIAIVIEGSIYKY